MNVAAAIVANVAGLAASVSDTGSELSWADELGLLGTAEIARHGDDAGRDLARELTVRDALATLQSLPAANSAQVWSDADVILRDAGGIPRLQDVNGPVAYVDQVFRPRRAPNSSRFGPGTARVTASR